MNPDFLQVVEAYSKIIKVDVSDYVSQPVKLNLPFVPQTIMEPLINTCADIFLNEPPILELKGRAIIVGDLHGHILDLFRIMKTYGMPPKQNYIFLGNLVNYGEFSTETVTFIFALKVVYPEHIFVIRGQHEFAMSCKKYGLSGDLLGYYGTNYLETTFLRAFACLPIAAVLNKKICMLHGGFGPNTKSLITITDINRPLYEYDQEPAYSVFWSEHNPAIMNFRPNQKKNGFQFGPKAVYEFLDSQNLDVLVRSNEFVEQGYSIGCKGKLITLISASNFCGQVPNMAGFLVAKKDGTYEPVAFPPIDYVKRASAVHPSHGISAIIPIRLSMKININLSKTSRVESKLPSLAEPREVSFSKTGRDKKLSRYIPKRKSFSKRVIYDHKISMQAMREVTKTEKKLGMSPKTPLKKSRLYG